MKSNGWSWAEGAGTALSARQCQTPLSACAGTSRHLRRDMGPMRKSSLRLSVPLTLVPEAAVSNDYWESESTTGPGAGKRKQRWVGVGDGSPKSSGSRLDRGSRLAPQSPLQGPGPCFCGIFPPMTLPVRPAVWLCLNCHPAKGAWWHAQSPGQQTHRVWSPRQNFFKT